MRGFHCAEVIKVGGTVERSDLINEELNFISALIAFAALDMRQGLHCMCKLKGQL